MQELQFLIIPIPGEETKIITKFSQQVRTLSTSVTRQQKSMKLCVKANSRDFSSSSANNESTEVSLGGPKWWRIFDQPFQNSLEVATKFMNSGEPVTADILNKILSIYNIYITDEGLNLLINTPKLKFDNLSVSLHKDPEFLANLVTGAQNKDREVKGVYIFTHKNTGSKYVGSSIQLVTRIQRYLAGTHREYGKFIPF